MLPTRFKYKKLLPATEIFLSTRPEEEIAQVCNGVGSNVGWFNKLLYHITPDTIWFLSIKTCADIHDVDYTFPKVFSCLSSARIHKKKADRNFLDNMLDEIETRTRNRLLLKLRRARAYNYYYVLQVAGWAAFAKNKIIG